MLAHPAKLWLIDTDLDVDDRYGTNMSPRNHSVAFVQSQHHVINSTNPRGALDDRIEHRLHVRGRAADDAEHLSRCRLMLQGLAQFCVALLDLFEQPHVLDGDHRLICKGFKELDLLVREGPDFRSANLNRPDGNSLSKQWRSKNGAVPELADEMAAGTRFLALLQGHECERFAGRSQLGRQYVSTERPHSPPLACGPYAGYMLKHIALHRDQSKCHLRRTGARPARDRVKHRLNVRR